MQLQAPPRVDGCYHDEYRRGLLRGSNVPFVGSGQWVGQPSGPNTVSQPLELGGKEGEAGQGLASLKL